MRNNQSWYYTNILQKHFLPHILDMFGEKKSANYILFLYQFCLKPHLIFIVSTSWFEGMGPTNQYSGLISLCNNSDKILTLRLQHCYKIITSNNNFALIFSVVIATSQVPMLVSPRLIKPHQD